MSKARPELVAMRPTQVMVGGLSESTIRRLIEAGTFPQPVVLSRTKSGRPCRIAFVRAELEKWVAGAIERGRSSHRGTSPEAA
jgi:predicted DNA-binding transcriptional regulator AlpA